MVAVKRILLFSVLLLVSCQQQAVEPGVLRVGLAQLPMSLDPRFATDAASHKIQALVHRGLVRLDDGFRPQPDVAKSWEHPDALTWLFYLQSDVYFYDGASVTAADVKATLQGVLDSNLASPLRAGFSSIDSIEVVELHTLRITLNKPDSSILTRLSLGIVPERLANQPHQARDMMGCGYFQVQSWQGNDLRLQRIQTDAQDNSESNIHSIVFTRVKDAVTRSLKLVRGEIDFAQNDLPADLLPYLEKQPNLQIQTRPSTTFSYIGLNMQDKMLKDVRVRRALALAVDRKRLKKALFSNLPELAETVLAPSHWATTSLALTAFDAIQAELLLDEAGFKRGANGIRFELNYRTSTDPARLRLATAIADMWQQIGVHVTIESLEWGGFYARIKRGDFQVFSLSWVGIVDPDIYRWILHTQMWPPKGANRGRYSNAKVDDWLEAAAQSENMQQRQQLYAQIQHQMQDDQVYIPLWYEPVIAVSSKRVKGFKPAADGGFLGLLKTNIQE